MCNHDTQYIRTIHTYTTSTASNTSNNHNKPYHQLNITGGVRQFCMYGCVRKTCVHAAIQLPHANVNSGQNKKLAYIIARGLFASTVFSAYGRLAINRNEQHQLKTRATLHTRRRRRRCLLGVRRACALESVSCNCGGPFPPHHHHHHSSVPQRCHLGSIVRINSTFMSSLSGSLTNALFVALLPPEDTLMARPCQRRIEPPGPSIYIHKCTPNNTRQHIAYKHDHLITYFGVAVTTRQPQLANTAA